MTAPEDASPQAAAPEAASPAAPEDASPQAAAPESASPAAPEEADPQDAAPEESGPPGGEAGNHPIRRIVVEIAQTLLLTAAIFFVIQSFIAQPFRVVGASMESTFEEGQYVLVDRISHLWVPYTTGQVVVLRPPADFDERGEPFIKRIVGVAGDSVEIRDGQVWVNGAVLDEPYLHVDPETGAAEPTEASMDGGSWVVPEGHVLVMGDHRVASSDGRDFGPVPVASIVGRALIRYWPLPTLWVVETPDDAK